MGQFAQTLFHFPHGYKLLGDVIRVWKLIRKCDDWSSELLIMKEENHY